MRHRRKNRKKLNKALLLIAIFLLVAGTGIFAALYRKNTVSAEDYSVMEKASLPLISLSYINGKYETTLHGYVNEMDNIGMRGSIVPLSEDRSLKLFIDELGNEITSLSYSLRSLNDEEYIDGGEITSFKRKNDRLTSTVTFSNLLLSGSEYLLVLELKVPEKTVYYYCRVFYSETNYAKELLSFTDEFTSSLYDREKAQKFLVNYIQPTDAADSEDYSYADIHSKYSMLTFGSLSVEKEEECSYTISELEPTQLSLTKTYEIRLFFSDEWVSFQVEEFFCVRYRSEKVYILDYYRKLNQEFDAENSTAEKGRIILGIGDGNTQILNSDNNVYTVFVEDREIWSYNSKNNAMSLIFSFADEEDVSARSAYDHHDVQVVKVSDDGSVDYMVYGYMNRGTYEGQVGICFYRYNRENNAAKRLFFMPVRESEEILMMDLGTLAYVNDQDVCYLRYGDGIYSIDLKSGESVSVTLMARPGMYAMNEKGNVVAWQEGEDLLYPERLVILNMDTQTTIVVKAPEGLYVKILDFIGDDIVYGFGEQEDSVLEANVDTQQLLKSVIIASTDERLEVRQKYDAEGFFILDAEVEDKRIVIKRGEKNDKGVLKTIEDDVLLLTQELYSDTEKSMLMSRNNGDRKKEYYIQIGTTTGSDSQFSRVVPRFEILKTANVIELRHEQSGVYYVYGYGKLLYAESEINKAIDEAFEVFGVVVDEERNYLWTRGTRDLVKNIAINSYTAETEEETLSTALRILVAQDGMQLKNASESLDAGMNPMEIIDEALGEGTAVNLYGCSLSEVLYFLNEGHPVLAVTGDREAVVLTGYDTTSVSIYFPLKGTTEKILMEIAEDYFEGYDNAFISYY